MARSFVCSAIFAAVATTGCANLIDPDASQNQLHAANADREISLKAECAKNRLDACERSFLSSACDAQFGDACSRLGLSYRNGSERDITLARAAFDKGCVLQSSISCDNLAYMYWEGNGVQRDQSAALRYAKQACELGPFPKSCVSYGSFLFQAEPPLRDVDAGRAVLSKHCDKDYELACQFLARALLEETPLTAGNAAAAVRPSEKACASGYADACAWLGRLYRDGVGVKRDFARARTIFAQGCYRASAAACDNLAYLHWEGKGGAVDQRQALQYIRLACDMNVSHSCGSLGAFLFYAKPPLRNDVEARAMLARECDKDNALACNNLGFLIDAGRGGRRDLPTAVSLFRRACDLGEAFGCCAIAHYQFTGIALAKNIAAALPELEKGCRAGCDDNCRDLGIHAQSLGRKDQARALFAKACSLGDSTSCRRAGQRR